VRLRLSKHLQMLARACASAVTRLAGDRRGNFALTFGLLSVPIILGVGCSLDYARTYNIKVKMQSDLDSALISAVKGVDTLTEAQIRQRVKDWFNAQSADGTTHYELADSDITINKATRAITAQATATVPTTLLGIINVPSLKVNAKSAVSGPASSYLNVYIVLDKSASMMLAATASGQAQMQAYAESSCVFACHTAEGDSKAYNGVVYKTNFALARAMGVTLRTDIAVDAAKNVISQITSADPTHSHIKVGLYAIGSTGSQVLAPTFSTSTATSTLTNDANGLTSATSQATSYFNVSLPQLAGFVGNAGDGSTADKPLKLVLMLTDGVQSDRPWVTAGDGTNLYVTPLNPSWCQSMKTAGATVGVLYTKYLPMTWDWGYNRTLALKLKNSGFVSKWKGTVDTSATKNILSVDYIPYALSACASSSDMYISAADATAISTGLGTLFQQYLGSVRLTQ